jgi:hypothetical protein
MIHASWSRLRVAQMFRVAAGATLLGSLAVVGLSGAAGASVQRNQISTLDITVAVFAPAASSANVHEYTVTLNPCDGTFSGTGGGFYGLTGAEYVTESISGSYTAGSLTLNATYDGTVFGNPYTYTSGPVNVPLNTETSTTVDTWSGATSAGTYPVWVTVSVASTTSFANHGQFVAAAGGGSDAAHSCVGMPVQSQS